MEDAEFNTYCLRLHRAIHGRDPYIVEGKDWRAEVINEASRAFESINRSVAERAEARRKKYRNIYVKKEYL